MVLVNQFDFVHPTGHFSEDKPSLGIAREGEAQPLRKDDDSGNGLAGRLAHDDPGHCDRPAFADFLGAHAEYGRGAGHGEKKGLPPGCPEQEPDRSAAHGHPS